MSGVVGSLLVKLSAITAEFDKAMDKSAGKVRGVENTIGKTALGTALGIGIAKGVGLIGQGIESAVRAIPDLLAQMDDVVETSQKIGIDTRSFLTLDVVAKESATSIESVGKAIGTMRQRIAEGKGFKELGFTQEQLKNLGAGGAFEALANKIASIDDPMERTRVATEMFGKAGKDLDGVIMNLKDGYSAWADEIADPKAVEALARQGDALEKFMRKAKNVGIGYGGNIAQAYENLSASMKQPGFYGEVERMAAGWEVFFSVFGAEVKESPIVSRMRQAGDEAKKFNADMAAANEALKKLQEQYDKAGMTDAGKRKYDFMQTAPDAKRIEEFDKLNGLIEAQNELEEMGKKIEQERNQQLEKAKSNWDSLMQKAQDMVKAADPIAGYAEKIRDLRRALGEGKITDAQFQATVKVERGKTLDDLAKDFKPADLVPALIMGTKEAYMAIAKSANNPQLTETRKTNVKLEEIKKKLDFAETSL